MKLYTTKMEATTKIEDEVKINCIEYCVFSSLNTRKMTSNKDILKCFKCPNKI